MHHQPDMPVWFLIVVLIVLGLFLLVGWYRDTKEDDRTDEQWKGEQW